MVIEDQTEAIDLLEYGNYFVIINGYKELFIDKTYTGPDEHYKSGTSFKEIYAMYLFDRKLRALYLQNILEIENSVKSILSRVFSAKYGHDNYLRINHFDTVTPIRKNQTPAEKVGDIIKMISTIQADIAQQLQKNNPMITHYQLNYGFIPLWVLVNILTLGTVSKFYNLMFQTDQNDVGKKFGLRPHEMLSFLDVLTLYRNTCAHGGRLYNFHTHKRIMKMPIHTTLGIPVAGPSGNFCRGQKDLFAVSIIFKLMLKKESFLTFFDNLTSLITELASELHTVSIDDVLHAMGFPANWSDLKLL